MDPSAKAEMFYYKLSFPLFTSENLNDIAVEDQSPYPANRMPPISVECWRM